MPVPPSPGRTPAAKNDCDCEALAVDADMADVVGSPGTADVTTSCILLDATSPVT